MKKLKAILIVFMALLSACIFTVLASATDGVPCINSSDVTGKKHNYEEALAHDGSYKCAVCGWLDRNSSSLKAPKEYTDQQGTYIAVGYDVVNSPAFKRDSATITFQGGFLDNELTLGLFNGRLVTKNGDVLSYGEKNAIGYVGAELSEGLLSFKYAFPPADDDHLAGQELTLSYTIRYLSEDGIAKEESGNLTLKYVNYGMTTQMTEYGATLNLTFYSTQGTVIRKNVYNVGDYSVTISDYYGRTKEYAYRIEESLDVGTSITREDTENGIIITIERNDGNSVIVTLPEGTTGVTVEGNRRPSVKVTITESVKFSYMHIDREGYETERFISVDVPTELQQKPILERLGYTTVDWNDDSEYALASDNLTKYRDGNVTVYLTNCIFKSTRSMVCFTFTPGGVTSHTFSKDDILLIENDKEHELTEDVTVSVGATLINDHVFLDATCTEAKICKYCSYTEGEPMGHDMKSATCTEPKACTICGYIEGEATGHKYSNDCDPTCDACGESRTVAEHTDADEDFLCDKCGISLSNNAGIQVGAIVGIIIGSVALLGGGGFALFWFVIRKKKINN